MAHRQGQQGEPESADLKLTFLIKRVDGEYEALCLELDIAACGDSEERVIESLKGLIELYVDDCKAARELPIPLRRVSRKDILEFLSPPPLTASLPFTSYRDSFPVHVPV